MKSFIHNVLLFLVTGLLSCIPIESKAQVVRAIDEFSQTDVASGRILNGKKVLFYPDNLKDAADKEFEIEVIYQGSECNASLSSLEVFNARLPLTFYELDGTGARVHVLFNPELDQLKNNTTYLVEDYSLHTDTIHILFDKKVRIEKIFPNPGSGHFRIAYTTMDTSDLTIEIFTITGKQIYKRNGDLFTGKIYWTLTSTFSKKAFTWSGLAQPVWMSHTNLS